LRVRNSNAQSEAENAQKSRDPRLLVKSQHDSSQRR
jgi:hypothetical protein